MKNKPIVTDTPGAGAGAAAAPARARKSPANARRAKETAQSVAVSTPTLAATPEPTFDEIARLAHSYWEARGCQGGPEEQENDWYRAEQELRARR
jgi:hypothetical protein